MADDAYPELIRSSPSLLLVLDEALTCRDLSRAWRDRLGTDAASTGHLTAEALFDVEDDPKLLGRLAAVLRDGTSLQNEAARMRVSDGTVPCRLSAWRPTRSEPLIAVAATDVSDYADAVAQLAQLESQHRLILDAAGEGIYGLDRDGLITFGNAAAAEIVGWVDVLGQKAHDVHHHSHRDGSPYAAEDCPIYAALKDGEVHTVDGEVFWHANGTAIPVEYTSTPILKEGKPDGAVVIFRNVSQRKELERQRAEAFKEITALKDQLEQERDYLRDEINVTLNFGEIIGESQALRRTLVQTEAVAPTPANVLVLGESGVGKEMIARAIHFQSDRSDKPLVKVNCASIPKDLFESEFFGHVRGAFTGAHRERTGRLQLADGGTLFLDEVGEIPLSLQGKLLRALQEREFERVGDDRTVRVDVRVVAATNRNLAEDVKAGRFREDLFYRLSVFPIEVPPLRERVDDIAPLAAHFLDIICKELGRDPPRMTRQQLKALRSHRWPGNIRELANLMERLAILYPDHTVQVNELPAKFRNVSIGKPGLSISSAESGSPINGHSIAVLPEDGIDLKKYLTEIESHFIHAALDKADGVVAQAAELLHMRRTTLVEKMRKYQISRPSEPATS